MVRKTSGLCMTGQQHSLGLHEDMHAHGAHKIDNGDQVKPALCCSILALGPQFGNIKGQISQAIGAFWFCQPPDCVSWAVSTCRAQLHLEKPTLSSICRPNVFSLLLHPVKKILFHSSCFRSFIWALQRSEHTSFDRQANSYQWRSLRQCAGLTQRHVVRGRPPYKAGAGRGTENILGPWEQKTGRRIWKQDRNKNFLIVEYMYTVVLQGYSQK